MTVTTTFMLAPSLEANQYNFQFSRFISGVYKSLQFLVCVFNATWNQSSCWKTAGQPCGSTGCSPKKLPRAGHSTARTSLPKSMATAMLWKFQCKDWWIRLTHLYWFFYLCVCYIYLRNLQMCTHTFAFFFARASDGRQYIMDEAGKWIQERLGNGFRKAEIRI